jgi:hypothetical protein
VLAAIVVLVIAQRVDDPLTVAFARAARGVLGAGASVQLIAVELDPPDEESVLRAQHASGVVELSWTDDGTRASIHSYVSSEQRWIDREITFSKGNESGDREASEKGRLLGFAAATMFTSDVPPPPERTEVAPAPTPSLTKPRSTAKDEPAAAPHDSPGRTLEFAGIASSGLKGTAAGLGAMAGFRLRFQGPLWARAFFAGRSGNMPKAQASTRTALVGGGAAIAAFPSSSRFDFGLRLDGFASYFAASHLSEDDVVPDERSRWLPGADLVAEGGFRFAGSAGLYAGVGLEAMFGRTDIYTHGVRVAVVPPLRAIGEIGFRTGF